MRNSRLYTIALATLCWAQVAVVVLSWILGALLPQSTIRSMLRGEAVRWFCSHFVQFCASPLLVWLLLLAMAAGVLRASGIIGSLRHRCVRRRTALVCIAAVTVLFLVATAMLTLVPHAVLLSAVGSLWHSPFSAVAIPLAALYVVTVSTAFGIAVGRFRSFAQTAVALTDGIGVAAPLLVLFIVASVFVHTVIYVFFSTQ